ncbi:MAG: hypothetical protein PQJ58_01760 [Spirochaetales bacterium]|nr:hypothetical protein [Spirochaetales bacterium]
MKDVIDKKLREFFCEEVRLRKEPQVEIPAQRYWKGGAAFLVRLGTAAACLGLLWVSSWYRQDHPLDTLVPRQKVQILLDDALQTADHVVKTALFRES